MNNKTLSPFPLCPLFIKQEILNGNISMIYNYLNDEGQNYQVGIVTSLALQFIPQIAANGYFINHGYIATMASNI